MEKVKSKKLKVKSAICFLLLSLACGIALAEDVSFNVSVDRNKISLDSNIKLNLNFDGVKDIPVPDLPKIEGFHARYLGPSIRMSVINGRVSNSITHTYTLLPLKTGTYEIPSISISYEGKAYTSQPISVEVVKGSPGYPQAPGPQQRTLEEPQGLDDRLFLTIEPGKHEAYINEIIPIMIKLYVSRLTVRDIQFPEFAHEGLLVEGFSQPRQYREVINGIGYEVLEFGTQGFATRAGELRLGPASAVCTLVIKRQPRQRSIFSEDIFGMDDFFGGYDTYPISLKSFDSPIIIKPLPDTGKPEIFNGAIGDYNFSLKAQPTDIKIGDPITLTIEITGRGNLKTVEMPAVDLNDDFKIYDPEVSQDERHKTFEMAVIPKKETVREIPAVSFSFFDTVKGEYKTITKGPIAITIRPLAKGEEAKVFESAQTPREIGIRKEVLGADIIYIKETPGELRKRGEYLFRNKLFILFLPLPLLSVLFIFAVDLRRQRLISDIRYARRLRAPAKARKNLANTRRLLNTGDTDKFFDTVFKTLKEYLGDKFHLTTAGITLDVVNELRSRSVDKDTLDKIKECFDACDRARYAPSSITREDMKATFKLLARAIDSIERSNV